jgi:hypothetical protein
MDIESMLASGWCSSWLVGEYAFELKKAERQMAHA